MTICMMTMVYHTNFRHMKKMKTAIGSCSMDKQLSKFRVIINIVNKKTNIPTAIAKEPEM